MSPLFETILVLNGHCLNLDLHERRIHSSRKELFNIDNCLSLKLLETEAENYKQGTYKMRLFYGHRVDKIEVIPYSPKSITSLRIVESLPFDYHLKFSDRSYIRNLLEKKKSADDIIISINTLVTDASYANLAFYDGEEWWTPAQPLLAGTRREYLIRTGNIRCRQIHRDSIHTYEKVSLINAMLDLDEVSIPIQNIIH